MEQMTQIFRKMRSSRSEFSRFAKKRRIYSASHSRQRCHCERRSSRGGFRYALLLNPTRPAPLYRDQM